MRKTLFQRQLLKTVLKTELTNPVKLVYTPQDPSGSEYLLPKLQHGTGFLVGLLPGTFRLITLQITV